MPLADARAIDNWLEEAGGGLGLELHDLLKPSTDEEEGWLPPILA